MPIQNYNNKLTPRANNLRNNSTLSEALLWNKIKQRQIDGYQFLRQKPIHQYIVDFYCRELRLAIEVDGSSHDLKIEEDKFRQKQLEILGITVIRFTDKEIKQNIDSVMKEITSKVKLLESC